MQAPSMVNLHRSQNYYKNNNYVIFVLKKRLKTTDKKLKSWNIYNIYRCRVGNRLGVGIVKLTICQYGLHGLTFFECWF